MPPTDPDDPHGLAAALSGDERAWERLVNEFSGVIWHWARSQGLDREEAADVAQMVWFKLKDRGHAIQDRRGLPGWLATTTRREAISARRKRDRRMQHVDYVDVTEQRLPAAGQPDPSQMAQLTELHESLLEAYDSLSEQCRELLAMCWNTDMSYQDIASALGTSVGYVGPSRQRCLKSLKQRAGLSAAT